MEDGEMVDENGFMFSFLQWFGFSITIIFAECCFDNAGTEEICLKFITECEINTLNQYS